MKTGIYQLVLIGAALTLASGCSGGKESAKTTAQQEQKTVPVDPMREVNRDQALRHFIQGSVFDAKGEYANAILEYQDALRLDQNAAIYYAISKDYSQLGKHGLAAQAAREAVKLDSLNIAYRENLASIYLSAFQTDQAIQEYGQILQIDSSSSSTWFALARLYQSSKPLKALAIYDRLLEREGDQWEVLYQSAELLNAMGRYLQAAERYERMLALDPGNRSLQRQLAIMYGRAGRTEEAIRMLEKMLELNDTDLDVVNALADIYMERREFDKAVQLYQKLLEQDKKNPELKLRMAIALFGQIPKDSSLVGKATRLLNEVKESLPDDWRAYWYLGILSSTGHNDSLAAAYFERVTQLAEWNADAWYYLGSTYFEQKKYDTLLSLMEKARKAVPKDHRMLFLSGLALSQLEQPQRAAEMLEQALALNPSDMNTLGTLALTYDGLHRYEDSDRLYEKALTIDPSSHIILNNYSYSLAERGLQLQRALQMSLKAIAAEPENSSYLDTVGWIYFKLGNLQEAEEYIRKSIKTGDASATVHEHLGDILYKRGEKQGAMQSWQKALELNSKNEELQKKISRGTL